VNVASHLPTTLSESKLLLPLTAVTFNGSIVNPNPNRGGPKPGLGLQLMARVG